MKIETMTISAKLKFSKNFYLEKIRSVVHDAANIILCVCVCIHMCIYIYNTKYNTFKHLTHIIYVYVYVCMYVYIYIYIYILNQTVFLLSPKSFTQVSFHEYNNNNNNNNMLKEINT